MSHKSHEWSKRIETSALQGLLDATVGRVAKLELHQAGVRRCPSGSIVVIDEELNVASIRIYTEPDTDVKPEVRVVSLREDNPLVEQLERLIESAPWLAFLAASSGSAQSCRARMKTRIGEVPR